MSRGEFFPVSGGEVFPAAQPRISTPETAQNAQGSGFRVITLQLDAALDNKQIKVKGNQLWVVDTTDLEVTANIKFNDVGGQGAPVAKGFALKGIPFNRIYLTAPAQAGKSITILTTDIPNAPIEFVNPTNSANEVKILKGTTVTSRVVTTVAVTNFILLPANPDRLGAIIKNSGLTDLLVGDDTTIALLTNGFPIGPGEIFVIDNAPGALLRGITGAPANLIVFEEFR